MNWRAHGGALDYIRVTSVHLVGALLEDVLQQVDQERFCCTGGAVSQPSESQEGTLTCGRGLRIQCSIAQLAQQSTSLYDNEENDSEFSSVSGPSAQTYVHFNYLTGLCIH